MRVSTIRFTSQNVKHLPIMNEAQVRHDELLTFSQSDVIGWQELQNKDDASWYWNALRAAETVGWETYAGGAKPIAGRVELEDDPKFDPFYSTPISWKTSLYEFVSGGRFILSKAAKGISGNRYLTWVKLRDRKTRIVFVVINVHMITGAHSFKFDDRLHRAIIWNKAFEDLVRFAKKFKAPIVILGDFNAHADVMTPRPRDWRVFNPKGIDHVILRGARWKVPVFKRLLGRFSDHQGARVTVKLK